MKPNKFKSVDNKVDFVQLEHEILDKWEKEQTFDCLREKNSNGKKWSFLDGPITANNPMGVHHAWGRSLKDIFQRYHAMQGCELRYQNGFDCQGLWVEVEVEKEFGFNTKRDIQKFGLEKFVNACKDRVKKFSKIQTEQSKRLGYWMDWENSYFTMSDENNYTIWAFLKKLFNEGKIYKGTDVVPWSGRSGTSYSQMEIIEGRRLVAHTSVFVRFPLIDKKDEYLLVWTTTPWTLTSNVAAAVNVDLDYVRIKATDGSIYYFADENLEFQRLEKQFKEKKQWIKEVPKLKTIAQIFKERGGFEVLGKIKGSEMLGWSYIGPFDELEAQSNYGGYPFMDDVLKEKKVNAISCHKVIDGGKDGIGNDVVVSGEGTGIVHIAPGCGAIDKQIGKKKGLVSIAPLDEESCYVEGFGDFYGKCATDKSTTAFVIDSLREKKYLVYEEKYPHVYPHCWRSGDELVFRIVDEWYINMDWRDRIKKIVNDINWIPSWGNERENEWLDNMGDWMISKKRFWGLALPIWTFEDGSFFVVGSKNELEELAVEGFEEFKGNSPHRPWIDKVKIRHPETGLIGTRIPDVGNPWLDAGIVPYSTLHYNSDKDYWKKWFPADFVVECFPGQFRNWFYSLLALSTTMEDKAPFKTLLGHALVKDSDGKEMHKSWGNAIWFDDAAEEMGVDVMRWMYASQNPEHNLLFGYDLADEVRKHIITLWNTYSFFITYANLDSFNPLINFENEKLTKSDLWIRSKMNEFIKFAQTHYESFQVYKIMAEATLLLDDISNWYVRRNRRRFWKSENDRDKNAAYSTLYSVLMDFIKVMAPIIPFITEKIYENLSSFDSNLENSIHLVDFPQPDENYMDSDLINEIDTVIKIVSMGRSARNKANIKIRQPLGELVVHSNKTIITIVENNKLEILEELNIKNLKIISDSSSLVKFVIKPNFQLLGKRFGDKMNDINKLIGDFDKKNLLNSCKANQAIELVGDEEKYEIFPEELLIQEVAEDGFSVNCNKDINLGVSITITDELMKEGMVRDLIRQVQNLRKDSGLKVEDRIDIGVMGSDDLQDALKCHKKYFMNEVLGVNLNMENNIESLTFNQSVKINGKNIMIGISPTS
ncbi:MAG: isoleucine--tRNA ligase [Candidatus Neomarinimicrobiota bacterium]|nr:isoleucine--tRNA ligase [Candidatus Neomarinimicrobiota bacterium]